MPHIAHVDPANPDFDLEALLLESIQRHDLAESMNGFGFSPLTTPESTPPSSPVLTPTTFLEEAPPTPLPSTSSIPTPSLDTETDRPSPTKRQKKNPDRILPAHRRERRNTAGNASRAKKRARKDQPSEAQEEARQAAYRHYVKPAPRLECRLDIGKAQVADGAHIGYDDGSRDETIYTLEDLIGKNSTHKLRLQTWDGE